MASADLYFDYYSQNYCGSTSSYYRCLHRIRLEQPSCQGYLRILAFRELRQRYHVWEMIFDIFFKFAVFSSQAYFPKSETSLECFD